MASSPVIKTVKTTRAGLQAGTLSLPGPDGGVVCLGGALNIFPHVDRAQSAKFAAFPSAAAFKDQWESAKDVVDITTLNKVRKCGACSKAVAFTLAKCNNCSASMDQVPISFTPNIFMSFIYGIERGVFPYTISVRSEDEKYLVFDDLLALSPCHLNVVPTSEYIPDWRYLLKNPEEGLKIVNALYDRAWGAASKMFLSDPKFVNKIFAGGKAPASAAEAVAAGFNYPPSQYQLHLQFLVFPLLPSAYKQYIDGIHFTPKRFFPIEYVKKVLEVGHRMDITDDTTADEIIEVFNKKGVVYDEIFKECYAGYGATHRRLANWDIMDFHSTAMGKDVWRINIAEFANGNDDDDDEKEKDPNEAVSVKLQKDPTMDGVAMLRKDKTILQNYGRPYSYSGVPTGSYYSYPKSPKDLRVWSTGKV